jgi:antitoxin component of RelBE/YafQ-DinJ toxin-antitoxin module
MKIVNFRVDDAEHQLMHVIASAYGMSLSGYIRHHFRVLAIDKGLVQNPLDSLRVKPEEVAEPANPTVERRQVPTAPNALRDEITQRIDSGERALDVAASYGMPIETVKAMYKRGKENQTAAREFAELRVDTGTNLVYDPVDPDNPTEEEQATNAKIARQRLVDMGLL